MELGGAFAVAVLLGLLVGHIADDRLGIGFPVFTMIGSLLGLAAGILTSVRLVRAFTSMGKE